MQVFPGRRWWSRGIANFYQMEDNTKGKPCLLLPAPKQLRTVIVNLRHSNGDKPEVPVDSTSGYESEPGLLTQSPAATTGAR